MKGGCEMSRPGRLILLPLGHSWPEDEDQRVFSMEELLDACGADLSLMCSAEQGMSPEAFVSKYSVQLYKEFQFAENIVAIAARGDSPMVMGEVLATRAWLEGEMPFLAQALWLLFVNEECELWFMGQLSAQGTFDAKISVDGPPPEWTLTRYQEQKFLVLTTRVSDIDLVRERAEEHFERIRFKNASPHPPTIPAPSDPPSIRPIVVPLAPRIPSRAGLRLVLPSGKLKDDE